MTPVSQRIKYPQLQLDASAGTTHAVALEHASVAEIVATDAEPVDCIYMHCTC